MKNSSEIYPRYERSWLGAVGLVARPEEEARVITKKALELGGDEAGARWLLQVVLYQYCGQTWGESLWCAEDADDLYSVEEVVKEMSILAKKGVAHIEDDLVEDVVRMVYCDPGDSALYLLMAEDLLGQDALKRIRIALKKFGLKMTDREWGGVLDEVRPFYQAAVEKLICEWDDSTLSLVFDLNLLAFLGTEEAKTHPAVGINTKFGVERVLEEIFARGLVTQEKDLDLPDGGVLTYEEACQIWEKVKG